MIAEVRKVRDFSKVGDAIPVPNLIDIQTKSYARFLQEHVDPHARDKSGLEGLLQEVFPIESYDGDMRLEYMSYELGKPRYTPSECRELRLTYGMPFRIRVRMHRKDKDEIQEDLIYLGELPIMIGGGEFIINGAERVIVSQLHRSPGVDFVKEQTEGDRALHACRIIPERGSWIEINVTKKDVLAVRIDQSSKIAATTFVRAMSPDFGSDEAIVKAFHKTKAVKPAQLKPEMYSVSTLVDEESGEEIVRAGCQIGDAVARLQSLELKQVQVISGVTDPLILNTLAEDSSRTHEEALLKIYARLRPGNPPQLEKARKLFEEKFYDENRYRLGKVGRFRLNRKLEVNTPDDVMTLRVDDLISCLKYLLLLRTGESSFEVDDIDHLGNRRLRTIDELATEELRKGFLKLRRTVTERMSLRNPDELSRIAELINSKSISSAIEFFFGRGELSQVVDQTNPLSQLTHERRLSALGPGGLNRKRAGFEVRDVHISHYGRICPIETPEGTNIGLIASLAIYSSVDDYGFLITPYRKVQKKGASVETSPSYLRADEEMRQILAPPEAMVEGENKLEEGPTIVRAYGDLTQTDSTDVAYVDISPKQTVGVSASLIPFLEHDDANRALMGSNMQRQAVPLLRVEPPTVATGMETAVAANSGMVVRSASDGAVTYVDAERIVINETEEFVLRKFEGLNERTCLNQKPIVVKGQKVSAGQIIADGPATSHGELSLGKNALVGFMTFDGYNFEDAIVISERLVKDDVFTSIHIDAFDVEIRETKLGREEFTADIPNVSERALRNLDEHGVVQVGTRVGPGDILVGKVCPKSKTELSPEEKLLHAIFGRAGEDVKNDSLEVPSGAGGIVIGTKRFSRRMHQTDAQKKQLEQEVNAYRSRTNDKICRLFRQMCKEIEGIAGEPMVDPSTRQKVGHSEITEVLLEQIEALTEQWRAGDLKWVKKATNDNKAVDVFNRYWPRISELIEEQERKIAQMKRGDELPSGVLEMVKVYIATKRRLSAGDKMAGRHGNKGVIARVVPEEDMPFLEDGTPLDILLNPLGVPSRMNVGQILETHLGWAMKMLGLQAVTPVFDGATEEEVHNAVREANAHVTERGNDLSAVQQAGKSREIFAKMPFGGKITVYDGRTGEPFDQQVTVGYMYMLKLDHLVDDKIHARATGPYSLITQQPLGGKARTGGQRFGEMEVWGLEAYGAAYMLQELLTVKSDDVEGRTKIYESMVRGKNTLEAGTPVSFDVLCNEIRGLGLNIQLEKKRIL
ncbi:MAG TPA: DNA-directed RNA polymerase subunit beta [Phycisphaerae bacterium]|nr:DNA-directed RNA polymerase subunit beta [Phycisphaerales bacterium]HRX85217.1 DNA-directed RNA polymerase subunit beta [Phycisphaerae bacterium]